MMSKRCFIFLILLNIPLLGEEEAIQATASYEFAFFKMLATLGIMLILIVVSLWMFRRLSQGKLASSNQSKSIKIIERRTLSAKSILYVVEFSGKQLLIAESQLEIRKIDEIPTNLKL